MAAPTGTVDPQIAGILASADALERELAGATYLLGGKSKLALDCSYFVYLVLNGVFPDYDYLSSAAITQSPLFTRREEGHKPGDIIYWAPSTDGWWIARPGVKNPDKVFPAHVGIVLDDNQWVGMQSSGMGRVRFNDRYFWGTRRAPQFYSYRGPSPAADTTRPGGFR